MSLFLLFSLAFGIGFLAAIPVGGCQIEVAKRVLQGRLLPGQMVVLGSFTADAVYGAVALFGIAPFMESPWVLCAFMALGAVLLWILAFHTLKQSRAPQGLTAQVPRTKGKRRAYATGFFLGISNAPTIMSWLLGVTLARHLGLAEPFNASAKGVFVAGGALGLGSYLSGLGFVIHRVKHFIPIDALGNVYRWLAYTLVVLSSVFVYGVATYFLW